MNKAVLISIQPKWCELIASGKKTIEVRKTRPKLETPFKSYIYCTKQGEVLIERKDLRDKTGKYPGTIYQRVSGKVIGEFVCDKIEKWDTTWLYGDNVLQRETCLNDAEIMDYMNDYTDRPFYLWKISDLKIYNKPKELGEFKRECKQYGAENPLCDDCRYYDCCKGLDYDESDCVVDGLIPLKRPFQSWGYVEVSE